MFKQYTLLNVASIFDLDLDLNSYFQTLRSWREMMQGAGKDYLEDMNLLNTLIWPRVSAHAYCSDSVSCDQFEGAHPFPVPRYGYEHVGQVDNRYYTK